MWAFYNPVRVVRDSGGLARLPALLPHKRIVLVTTSGAHSRGFVGQIQTGFGERLVSVIDSVRPNPDMRDIESQLGAIRSNEPDALIAVGGGSAIDTAKVLAYMALTPVGTRLVDCLSYGAQLDPQEVLPIVAVPTTAGAGAEVTPFATVWDHECGKKYSIAGPGLYPKIALLDPGLTRELPKEIAIASALDALSHALESIWNKNSNPVTFSLAAEALRLSLKALPELMRNPNENTRQNLMNASLLAGLAISQTRTAIAHSISYPLTVRFGLPHGIAASFMLPVILKYNSEQDDGRLENLAFSLGYDGCVDLAAGLENLLSGLGLKQLLCLYIPRLATLYDLVEYMLTPSRVNNNLRDVTLPDLKLLLGESISMIENRF